MRLERCPCYNCVMKSKVIRIRNLPADDAALSATTVKPKILLVILAFSGILILWMKSYLMLIGMLLILIAVFAMLFLPDRVLCSFHSKFMVLYNQHDRSECKILYYDEIVSWNYEWHPTYDHLVLKLCDGSTEIQEMYAKYPIEKWLNVLLPGKEVKKHAGGK